MRRNPDRLNRTVLTLLALLLLGAGGYGLARGYGAFGEGRADAPILTSDVRDFVSRNSDWFWPLAAVLSLLVAWLGLRWLLAQISSPGVHQLPVRSDGPGHTELAATGAASALARDIEDYPGVRGARARIVGEYPSPEVEITVDVHDDADIPDVRTRIEEHALERFRAALELQDLRSEVHIRLAERAGRTVR
ncbi:MAG TPA: alkaline shock response membrane anchor protein AmaP [Acidimicrobiales bacterium]|nr:alkaline shock response membrane anchor protein AmaP [Acidimicrobiales bacterium]